MLRRHFLRLIGAVAVLPGPVLRAEALVLPVEASAAVERLAGLFADPRSACALGRRALRAGLCSSELDRLFSSTFVACPVDPATADLAALRRFIGERARSDFADGRTINVDGWVLSRTEVQVAALVELSRARP